MSKIVIYIYKVIKIELIDRVDWIVLRLYLTLKPESFERLGRDTFMLGILIWITYTEKGMSPRNQTLKEKQKIDFMVAYGWTTVFPSELSSVYVKCCLRILLFNTFFPVTCIFFE